MKILGTAVLLSVLPVFFISAPSFAQRGYPLVCRGGGSLYFNYTPFSNFSPNPQIWISFQRAAQKAGSNWENAHALLPGQCTWLDRPVRPNEPNRIIVRNVRDFSISWQKGRVMGISSRLSYVNMLQNPRHFQSFVVYNDGKGNFIATRIGRAR